MTRKILRGQEDKKKMLTKAVDYLMNKSFDEMEKPTTKDKQAVNAEAPKKTLQAQQKQYETIFPNSLDYSNLTKPEMGIVSLIRLYRKKHGMSKFRNKEINERFINANDDSKYDFATEAIEKIKNDEAMPSIAKKYFVDRLETEKTAMLNQDWADIN